MERKLDPFGKKSSQQKLVLDDVIQQITAGNTSQGQYNPFGCVSPDGAWPENQNPHSATSDDANTSKGFNFDISFPNKIPESVLRRNKSDAFYNEIPSNKSSCSYLSDLFGNSSFIKHQLPSSYGDGSLIVEPSFLNEYIPPISQSISTTSAQSDMTPPKYQKDEANLPQAKLSYSDVVSSKGNPNRANSIDFSENSSKVSPCGTFDNPISTIDISPTFSRQAKFGTSSVTKPKSKQASGNVKSAGRLKRQSSMSLEDRSGSNRDQNFDPKSSFHRKSSGNIKKIEIELERKRSSEDPVQRYGLENISLDDSIPPPKHQCETKLPSFLDHKTADSFSDNIFTVMSDTDLCDVPLNNEQARPSSQVKVNMPKRTLNINNNLCNSKLNSRDANEIPNYVNTVKSCNQNEWNNFNKNKVGKPDRGNKVLDSSHKSSNVKYSSVALFSFFDFSSLFSTKVDVRQKESSQKRRRRKYAESYPYIDMLKTAFTYLCTWANFALVFLVWLFNLVCDVSTMSYKLLLHLFVEAFNKSKSTANEISNNVFKYVKTKLFNCLPFLSNRETKKIGLTENIELPTTGDEAMKRLLACQDEDPYGILGVTTNCSDDDIKKYYKRQAFLVHPDKNSQPGAEEAFKILGHAFDLIGKPEKRKNYDESTLKKEQISAAMEGFSELLKQLHKKMEEAANTICCTNCNGKHRRQKIDRPCFSARYCSKCKIRHPVKDGDLWAESYIFGLRWCYYSCMDGAIYDITHWAQCQSDRLKNLHANTHIVQYRIVTGGNNNNGNRWHGRKQQSEIPSEAELEDLLNNFYQQAMSGPNKSADKSTKAASNCTKKKTKKKRN